MEEVRLRILARRKKPEPKIDPLDRIKNRERELEQKRLERQEQRRIEKQKLNQMEESEMSQLMGFGGFGTSKSK